MKLPETSRIDVSHNELALRKLDRRDMWWRAFGFGMLLAIVGINIFGLSRLNQIGSSNADSIYEHRQAVEDVSQQAQEQIKVAATANKGRADIILCIISVSPTRRTQEHVKSCYDQVDQALGIKVQRFGDGL